jgi:hypothetical protein
MNEVDAWLNRATERMRKQSEKRGERSARKREGEI